MGKVLTLSRKAIIDLIIQPEVSSQANYEKKLRGVVWPGGASGLTIGLGYDIGMVSAAQVALDWWPVLPATSIVQLQKVAGITGPKCKQYLGMAIDIPWATALQVFYNTSLKQHARKAANTYPELEELHPYEQTAIVGLVYNRGASLVGERRTEMKELVDAIKADDDTLMAALIREMKRLWTNKQGGLILRREEEADYIELEDKPIPEEDKLLIPV